jgi:putative FmdB family regulatory protein
MPLYEYWCEDCQTTIEIIQKFSDPELSKCDKCGGDVERLLSAPAIRFKGSGWYVNDYGNNNNGGANRSDKSPDKSSTKNSSESAAPKPDKPGNNSKSDNSKVA